MFFIITHYGYRFKIIVHIFNTRFCIFFSIDNKRVDEYGGSIENRSRLLFEIYDSVRNAVGVDYPVALKLSFSDLVSDSSTPKEMLWVCKELEKKGIDFIEISSGISADNSEASCSPVLKKGTVKVNS